MNWSRDMVRLFHKGKANTDLDKYREIAISRSIGKLYEKVLTWRIQNTIEEKNMSGEVQGGFRKDSGCMDQVFVVTSVVEKALSERKPLYLCFIDLKKAYDSVWSGGLWVRLREVGLQMGEFPQDNGKLVCKIRTGGYDNGRDDRIIQCDKGVIQGGVISGPLFAVYLAMAPLGERLVDCGLGVLVG